jgi:hypothetical protein
VNYLAICQQTRQECDASGTGPSAVTNQTGESKRFVDWCAQAYTEIQNKRGDPAAGSGCARASPSTRRRARAPTPTARSPTSTTSPITRFKDWYPEFQGLPYVDRRGCRVPAGLHGVGPVPALLPLRDAEPRAAQHFSIDPDMQVRLGPAPDAIYTVSGDYQRSAQVLARTPTSPRCRPTSTCWSCTRR